MYERIDFHIRGITPTIIHNGRMANPMDPYAKRLKEVSKKRTKTDADFEAMAQIEWEGGHYPDEEGRSCWPGECIEAMFIEAAKKSKMGKQSKAGVMVDGLFPIIHPGPQKIADMWGDENFRIVNKVKVGQSSVMRTRPIFRTWELKFSVDFLPDIVNASYVKETIVVAGRLVGLSDWRPKYGRFEVVS